MALDASGTFVFSNYFALALFAMHLAALLTLVDRHSISHFCRNFYLTSSATAVLYIAFASAGMVDDHFGRLMFFGNSHPNLGGEIYGIAVFIGALCISKRSYFVLALPMIYATLLLQSRTGTVVIAGTIIAKMVFERRGRITKGSVIIGAGLFSFAALLLVLEGSVIDYIAKDVLLAEDTHRGASTGFITGRDAQWRQAWGFFAERPLFGHGMGLYSDGVRGAHNPLLYSLSMFGVFGFAFWVWIGLGLFGLLRHDVRVIVLLVPVSLMLILNDRFINSNSFPLLYYFLIVQLGRFAPNTWDMRSGWPRFLPRLVWSSGKTVEAGRDLVR
ncbi:O-antigen ligase family protein [Alphaproteobacteria bacterium KMM 3653]|uniref:O-antigen ligase family protein n=1 Tax=Harenicola maris TaxID=2841044 RepID=A0AAP2CR85_9RHOB|nr:O-antigen ligase family protein [Harenicola maris]